MEESNFKKLIVWQKAMDLVDEVYALQRGFPLSLMLTKSPAFCPQ